MQLACLKEGDKGHLGTSALFLFGLLDSNHPWRNNPCSSNNDSSVIIPVLKPQKLSVLWTI